MSATLWSPSNAVALKASIWEPGFETIFLLDTFTGSAAALGTHIPDTAPTGFNWITGQVATQNLNGSGLLVNSVPGNLFTRSDSDWTAISLPNSWQIDFDAIVDAGGPGNATFKIYLTSALTDYILIVLTATTLSVTITNPVFTNTYNLTTPGAAIGLILLITPTGFKVYINGTLKATETLTMTSFNTVGTVEVRINDLDEYDVININRIKIIGT